MQQPLVKRIPFAKIVIGLALVFLLSLGLCGLTLVMAVSGGPSSSPVNRILDPAGMVAIVGMLGSAAVLIVTCITWVILAIDAGMAKKVSQPTELRDEADVTKHEKGE